MPSEDALPCGRCRRAPMVHCPTATVAARPEGTPWVLDSTTIGLAPVRTGWLGNSLMLGLTWPGRLQQRVLADPEVFGCSCVTPLTRRREPQNRR